MNVTTPAQTKVRSASVGAIVSDEAVVPEAGRCRAAIENVTPCIDGGRFPVKRVVGEELVVEADAFVDGHDRVACALRYRREGGAWAEARMGPLGNDRWRGAFTPDRQGVHEYTVAAWADRFGTWRHDLKRWFDGCEDITPHVHVGIGLVREAAAGAEGAASGELLARADGLEAAGTGAEQLAIATDPRLEELMFRFAPRRFVVEWGIAGQVPCPDAHARPRGGAAQGTDSKGNGGPRGLRVVVDRQGALCGAWYELFPRSMALRAGEHGTLRDVEARLDYVAGMGFDVLYLPPIHPIGRTKRKEPNNAEEADDDDPGSPWAIGGREGGHKSVHPALGTLEDFEHLVGAAQDRGLEIALDIAFQCSPDHPCLREHPEWFRRRPDGSLRYTENPPKRYQDIYPFDFECEVWRELWEELKGIVMFWAERGVRLFRVDNPQTKPVRFWEWLIREVKRVYPDALFLSEAFPARPARAAPSRG